MESTRVGALVSYAGAVGFGMLVGVRLREEPLLVMAVALAALAVFCAWHIKWAKDFIACKRKVDEDMPLLIAENESLKHLLVPKVLDLQKRVSSLPTSQ